MATNFGIGFVVGASLAPTVATTFSTVTDKIKATRSAMAEAQVQSKALATAATTQTQLAEITAQRAQVAQRTTDLRAQKAGGSFVAASELRQAVGQYKALGLELDKAKASHEKATVAAKKHGIAVTDYTVAYQKAGVAIERHEARLKKLSAISAESDKRQAMRGQLGGTMAAVMTVAAPVKMAVDYESVMADVKKVTKFDAPGFKKFSNDLLSMSETIPMSATGLAEIAVAAGQAGIAEHELLRFTKDAAVMAVAFDITAQEAGSAMTGLRTNFKLSQDEVILLGDSFNTLANSMDAKAGAIVNFANRVGGTASIYKFTGQQVGALAATFAASKVDVESAATATNFLFARLGTADEGTDKAKNALNSIGMSGKSLAKAFKQDAQGALLNFLQRVKQSKDPMRVLNAVLGAEHAPKIAKLMNNLDLYNEALGKVANQSDYAGSMDEEYAARCKTTATAMQFAANKANRLGITLGSVVLPAIVSTLETVGPYVTAFTDFAAKHEGATTAVVGLVAGLVAVKAVSIPVLYVTSLLKAAWHGAALATNFMTTASLRARTALLVQTVATKAVTAGQWLMNAAMFANPIGIVVAGVAALAGWFAYAYNETGSLTGAVGLMWDQFKAVVPIMHVVESAITGTVQFITDLWNGVSFYDAGAKLMGTLGEGIKSMVGAVIAPFKAVAGFFGFGSDTASVESTAVSPTQTAHAALAGQSGTASVSPSAVTAPRPSASKPSAASMGAGVGVTAQFNIALNGIPDADFARRVVAALGDKKADVERLLSDIVNNQMRLAYGK